jgi:hypothetical protein
MRKKGGGEGGDRGEGGRGEGGGGRRGGFYGCYYNDVNMLCW